MKQIITIFIIMFTVSMHSQNDISGIGRFKIGMDISIIDSLKNEGYKYRVYDSKKDILGLRVSYSKKAKRKENPKSVEDDKVIIEKIKDVEHYGTSPMIDEHKTFIIQYYSVAGIDIDCMEIHFFKGKLYKINITENLDLITALGKKYKGEFKKELGKTITCTNAYRSVEYQEENFKNTYRDDNKITAYSMISTYYYECEKRNLVYIIVVNRDTDTEVGGLESAEYRNLKAKKDSDEKKSLDKL